MWRAGHHSGGGHDGLNMRGEGFDWGRNGVGKVDVFEMHFGAGNANLVMNVSGE